MTNLKLSQAGCVCFDEEPLRSLHAPTYSFNHPSVQRIRLGEVKTQLFHPCLPSWKRYEMDTVTGKPPEEHSQSTTTLCIGSLHLQYRNSVQSPHPSPFISAKVMGNIK